MFFRNVKVYLNPIKKSLVSKIFIAFIISFFSGIVVLSCEKIANLNENFSNSKFTIVIDPGHGGDDSGTISPSGVFEKNLNLKIALKLKNILKISGFNVVMTRETDTALHGNVKKKKKRTDLNKRLKIIKNAQKSNNNNSIFISIHQNNFQISKYSGSQIFFSSNNPKSEILASCIRKSITKLLQKENERELKSNVENIFLLKHSTLPSCLIECGFLSNPEEERKLQDPEYQNQLAFCIYCGICDYFFNN